MNNYFLLIQWLDRWRSHKKLLSGWRVSSFLHWYWWTLAIIGYSISSPLLLCIYNWSWQCCCQVRGYCCCKACSAYARNELLVV